MPCPDAAIIRSLWSVVEKQAHFITNLSDDAIASWLVRQVRDRIGLTSQETEQINSYVMSRLMLIRTVAESCHASESG